MIHYNWLTANCEIVMSVQWLTKYERRCQQVNMKKNWTRLLRITMMTSFILTSLHHCYDKCQSYKAEIGRN